MYRVGLAVMHLVDMQPSGGARHRVVLIIHTLLTWLPIGTGTVQPEDVLKPTRRDWVAMRRATGKMSPQRRESTGAKHNLIIVTCS